MLTGVSVLGSHLVREQVEVDGLPQHLFLVSDPAPATATATSVVSPLAVRLGRLLPLLGSQATPHPPPLIRARRQARLPHGTGRTDHSAHLIPQVGVLGLHGRVPHELGLTTTRSLDYPLWCPGHLRTLHILCTLHPSPTQRGARSLFQHYRIRILFLMSQLSSGRRRPRRRRRNSVSHSSSRINQFHQQINTLPPSTPVIKPPQIHNRLNIRQ